MVIVSLSPLRARISDNYRYRDSWKSDDQEKKQRTDTINESKKIKSDNFTRGKIEKRPILLSPYWKI